MDLAKALQQTIGKSKLACGPIVEFADAAETKKAAELMKAIKDVPSDPKAPIEQQREAQAKRDELGMELRTLCAELHFRYTESQKASVAGDDKIESIAMNKPDKVEKPE